MIKITTVNDYSFKIEAFGEVQIKPKGYENYVSSNKLQISSKFDSDDILVPYTSFDQYTVDGVVFSNILDLQLALSSVLFNYASLTEAKKAKSGYSRTGAFSSKPSGSNYIWQEGEGVSYSQDDVDASTYKVFSLSRASHTAVDNPYWSVPPPSGKAGIGLFQGANLPSGVSTLFDYDYDYDIANPSSSGTGFEGSMGRIKLNDLNYGDQLRVRFDFNVIPQIANTTIEPALWYSNRDINDVITATFPLTAQPIFYGSGTSGNTYLNRVEISAWITSIEDINALALPSIKSDNPVIIQPLGILTTIIR